MAHSWPYAQAISLSRIWSGQPELGRPVQRRRWSRPMREAPLRNRTVDLLLTIYPRVHAVANCGDAGQARGGARCCRPTYLFITGRPVHWSSASHASDGHALASFPASIIPHTAPAPTPDSAEPPDQMTARRVPSQARDGNGPNPPRTHPHPALAVLAGTGPAAQVCQVPGDRPIHAQDA